MNMRNAITSFTIAAILPLSAMAQTMGAPLPPAGPYPVPMAQQQVRPNWTNLMPVPYWMQNRSAASAPKTGGNTTTAPAQTPVYPAVPPSNRGYAPALGWAPFGIGRQDYYPQGGNNYYRMPQPFYGQMPPMMPNGPWGGFVGPTGPIYGYQPAYRAPNQLRR